MAIPNIKLGDTVRDKVSGIEGIAVARTQYMTGCDRISIQPRGEKDGKPFDWLSVDITQLDKLDTHDRVVLHNADAPKSPKPAKTGGPRPEVSRR